MVTRFTDLSLYSLHYTPGIRSMRALHPQFDIGAFSRFKYGDKEVADEYARMIALKLVSSQAIKKSQPYLLSASASQNVPTAANSIAQALKLELEKLGFFIVPFEIYGKSFCQDYSKLNGYEREAMLATIQPAVKDPFMSKMLRRYPAIIVDDIRVTGLHQSALKKLAKRNSWKEVVFSYVASLDPPLLPENAQLEWQLNHAYVNNLQTLSKIIMSGEFSPNARVCKFILSAPTDDLQRFLHPLSYSFLQKLAQLIQSDGYDTMCHYKAGFAVVRRTLQQRPQILSRK